MQYSHITVSLTHCELPLNCCATSISRRNHENRSFFLLMFCAKKHADDTILVANSILSLVALLYIIICSNVFPDLLAKLCSTLQICSSGHQFFFLRSEYFILICLLKIFSVYLCLIYFVHRCISKFFCDGSCQCARYCIENCKTFSIGSRCCAQEW